MAEIIANPNHAQSPGRPKFRPWRELAFHASIFMELSWVALWSRILLRNASSASYARIFVVLGAILLLVYTAAWAGERLSLRLSIRRGVVAILVVASVLAGLELLLDEYGGWSVSEVLARPLRTFDDVANFIPVEFILMLLLLLVIWRGITMVGRHIEPVVVIGGFRTGILMFFAYGLLVPLQDSTPMVALVLFLFSSLMGMSAARIAVLSQLRGGHAIPFDRQWVGGIAFAVVCMVGLAVAVAEIMGGEGFTWLSRLVTGVVYVLAIILSPLVWLVMQLVFWLGELFRIGAMFQALLEILRNVENFLAILIATIERWMNTVNVAVMQKVLNYLALGKPLILWGTILFFVVIVLLTVRKHIWKSDHEPDEQEIESLLNQKSLFDLMRDALRRGLGKMRDDLMKMAGLRHVRRLFAAARIRRIYARLLDLSARLNEPRPASRTPLEFLPSLEHLFPGLSGELQMITHAYLVVRYGDLPETSEEVEQVNHAWRAVLLAGQEQLKARRRNRD